MFLEYLQKLQWRYATKKFDPAKKLSDEELNGVLEAMRLAPSSLGLQPWKFVVVTNPELRLQLREASWGQAQITECSHLIVLCTPKTYTEVDVQKHLENTAKVRGVSVDVLGEYKKMILGMIQRLKPEELLQWMRHQTYLALGFGLSAAAENGVDACPMEGFDNVRYDEILGLSALGYSAAVVCALGHRAADDVNATQTKVRFSQDEVTLFK